MRYMKPRKIVFSYKLRVNWDKACIDDLGRQTVVDSGKEVRSRLTDPYKEKAKNNLSSYLA